MPSDTTNISWTDSTWNVVTGCSKVSPGCAHCYAETISLRFKQSKLPWTPANAKENVVLHPERLDQPLRWKSPRRPERLVQPLRWTSPRRIFVNSMSDLFHEAISDEFLDRVFAVMALSPQHTFQVLTKRPERMLAYFTKPWLTIDRATFDGGPWPEAYNRIGKAIVTLPNDAAQMLTWAQAMNRAAHWMEEYYPDIAPTFLPAWPLPNVWLGVSVENQHWADVRIPVLLETPAAVRFLSCEPLLGPIDLNPLRVAGGKGRRGLHWCIIGGESGHHLAKPQHKRRWMKREWAESLVAQCRAAGVSVFFKQESALRSETRTSPWARALPQEFPR